MAIYPIEARFVGPMLLQATEQLPEIPVRARTVSTDLSTFISTHSLKLRQLCTGRRRILGVSSGVIDTRHHAVSLPVVVLQLGACATSAPAANPASDVRLALAVLFRELRANIISQSRR
jgi:hypothetical protein